MADTVIGARLQVDAGNTGPTIKEVREQIKLYKSELDNATVGSEQHRQALEKLAAANQQLNPTFSEQGNSISKISDHLSSTVPAFGRASEGAKGFGATLKALMANPIVLIVAALVAGLKFLYDAFTSTTEGAKEVAQVFAGIEQVVKVLFERVMAVGRALIELFSGHFKKAWQDGKAALSGIGEEIEKTYTAAVEGTKKLQALKIRQRQEDLANARADAEIAKLRESILDESIPIKQRIANAERVKQIDKARSEEGIRNAKDFLAAKIQIWSTEFEWQKKHADELNELNISIANKEREAAQTLRATERSERQLNKQADAEEKAKEKEAEDKRKELRQAAREAERTRRENQRAYNDKLQKLEQENALALIRDSTEKKLQEHKYASQKEIAAIEEDFKQKKITRAQYQKLIEQQHISDQHKIDQINEEHQAELEKKAKEAADKYLKQQEADAKKERELMLKAAALKVTMAQKDYDLKRQELDLKQSLIEKQYKEELEAAKGNALQIREIELKHQEESFQIAEARKAISKAETDAKITDFKEVGSAATAIGQLIGQQTVIGKGVSIAAALINTYEGATKALAQGGIAGIAGAISVTAAGLASIQKIASTQIPGQGGGSSPSVSAPASVQAPLKPQAVQTTTTLDQASINSIGNATNRAFVLETDIKNNQERTERLNRASRIG